MPKKSTAGKRASIPPPPCKRIWVPTSSESIQGGPVRTDGEDSSSTTFSNDIAASIHEVFEFLTKSAGSSGGGVTAARPGRGQWTVVAGFVALEDVDGTGGTTRAPVQRTVDETTREGIPTSPSDHEDPTIPVELTSTPFGQSCRIHHSGDRRNLSGKWRKLRVCSVASGVKCLGGYVLDSNPLRGQPAEPSATRPVSGGPPSPATQRPRQADSWSERDSQLVDMHAEILARRELECLLMREMRTLVKRYRRSAAKEPPGPSPENNLDEDPEPFLLELVFPRFTRFANPRESPALRDTIIGERTSKELPIRPWFRLKPSIQLVLYTSHAPCGAASDAAHLRRLDAEDAKIGALFSRLGIQNPATNPAADGLHHTASPVSAFRESKSLEVPPICKKPSRADAPPTTAFSCSDKLGRWQWLGFQGGRLAPFFERRDMELEMDAVVDLCTDRATRAPAPVRLGGLIVGEDYEKVSLRKIFGRGGIDGSATGYARLGQGLDEVLCGKADSYGKRWLQGLLDEEPCGISHSTVPFAYGRAAAAMISSNPESEPSVPPSFDLDKLCGMPLPLLRDVLLPPPASAPVPFPVALSYHAYSTPQAIGPNGRLSGVTRDKKTKAWGPNSVARVARGRIWDAFEALVCEYEEVFGPIVTAGYRKGERRKGGRGWIEASTWMEAKGPYAGWHAGSDA
ncbi:hypothetical protein NliqN6_5362 [Naganishia liquefaciens]|uniref:tRNA-specific adenosine deaminase 1 n=1 Tax=Naganishia liquefaciens TaxID=104408 RepID=A0A8H3YGK5_9TREE|nr:hypothetical protein NliqN6_5362 [Naganishia liquefaciens]